MLRKIVLPILVAVSLLGCDSDFRQGSCDEGFFEQADGQGGTFCVPITEEDAVEDTILEADNLKELDWEISLELCFSTYR